MSNRVQYRRDTKARWAEVNPVLMEGEVGLEIDTKNIKMGDGVHAWNELEYGVGIENITSELGDSENLAASQKLVRDLANSIFGFSKSFTFNKVDNYAVSLSDVKFNKGQYACILVKTTPAISTVYNGNATNMSNLYPSLEITDGFGIAVVGPATSDGAALSTFGYGEASLVPSEHTAEFTIFQMKSADELPVKALAEKNNVDIQKNVEELNLKYILKTNSVSFNFSKTGNSSAANVYTKVVKAGQYIRVKVKTTPAIDTIYNGTAYNMNMQYPTLSVKNGIGEVVVGPATSNEGIVNQFGYGKVDYIPSDHKAEFITEVIDSPSDRTLKEQVQKNTENIQKNNIGWQEENIPSLLETPFEHNFRVPGYTAIIRSWGFIGDSLCSGEMECYEGSVKKYIDMYEYSWGQQICRLCGSEGYNYSSGGQTAKGWINSSGERGWAKAKTTPHQAYIIALGVNDSSQTTVGNIETDVDFSNYENNADTFAGNYCGIIQRIRSISERSIIFVVSDPRDNKLNEIIKTVPSKFDNVFLIDMTSLIPLYSNAEFNKKYRMGFYLNATGYLFTAYLFMHYIDYIIQKNPAIFMDIALWNTNYTAQAT